MFTCPLSTASLSDFYLLNYNLAKVPIQANEFEWWKDTIQVFTDLDLFSIVDFFIFEIFHFLSFEKDEKIVLKNHQSNIFTSLENAFTWNT